jgi:lysophospholipase L1-like esterase
MRLGRTIRRSVRRSFASAIFMLGAAASHAADPPLIAAAERARGEATQLLAPDLKKVSAFLTGDGIERLKRVRYYELDNDRWYRVRDEIYDTKSAGNPLRRVRWKELPNGRARYDSEDDRLVKAKAYDSRSGALTWVFEFTLDGALAAVQRYDAEGRFARGMIFDAEGGISHYTDRSGRPIGRNTTFRPVESRSPIHAPVFAAILERLEELGRNIDILFLGDSLTMNWSFYAEEAAVWGRYYGDRRAVNAGVAYDTTQNLLWRVLNGNAQDLSARAIVLHIGTNNLGQGDRGWATAEGVLAVLARLRRLVPEARIVLMGILPRGEPSDPAGVQRLEANELMSHFVVDRAVTWLDIGDTLAPDGARIPDFYGDEVHLNTAGYEVWGAALEPILSGLLDQPGG